MIFASVWVDTLRQPCDPGTRPDLKGALNISCPQYMKRRLFVEIYAVCAGITFECKRLGVETESPWDIEYGVRYDLTIPKNRRRLMRLLGSGLVLVVWWGTPCTTFAIARTPLRKAHDPGLPLDCLSERDMAICLEGNMLADMCRGDDCSAPCGRLCRDGKSMVISNMALQTDSRFVDLHWRN